MPSAANELDDKDEVQPKALDEGDIALLKTYVSDLVLLEVEL
jgi:hypothetical protein